MTPRGRDGSRIRRTVTSCASCLAWGLTYSQGVCLDCYNFAAPRLRRQVAECGACARPQPLKDGYCRLCWCQAREDRLLLADARSAVTIAPHLPNVGSQQLFLAGMHHKRQPKPPTIPRRYGAKGRPLKPPPEPVFQPSTEWRQPPLTDDVIRHVYVYGRFDLRTGPAPDNPWLAWALHIAHTTAEARGWSLIVRRGMQRTLVMLLAGHTHGDDVRVSDFQHVVTRHGTNVDHVVEILAAMGIAEDDRPRTFDRWLDAKVGAFPDAIRRDATGWARSLHDGGPRTHARSPSTAYGYVRAVQPALLAWAGRYDHLREITRDDISVYLDTLQGQARDTAHAALRSLFGWAKRNKLIFRNPVGRAGSTRRPDPLWQPLTRAAVTRTIDAATTEQARVFVALAAIHAARPGHIRAMQLDDVDLGNRRITVAGREGPLDDLTHDVLVAWLKFRRQRWPNTANPHLLVSTSSALGLGPVSATFLAPALRGLSASIERLRIDRQLEEALACGADPLHIAEVFGLDDTTAIKYASVARRLLDTDIEHHPAVHREPT